MSGLHEALLEISAAISGDVHSSKLQRGIYSTDASMYQIEPLGVVYPASNDDLISIVDIARKHQTPLLPRGGGTSLAGQTVGEAIVLDFTKYMNEVLEFDPDKGSMLVQPGITRDEVNAIAHKSRLEFAPDPATSSRATIGGMIANNSSGTKSILYGKTSDHVLGLRVLLADGTILELGEINSNASSSDLTNTINASKANSILTSLREIIEANKAEIEERFPKTMRRVSGYPLDNLLDNNSNIAHHVFIGSEGTLGVILEARIRLVRLPEKKGIAVLQFGNGLNAVKAVQHILPFNPAAIEILSRELIDYSRKNIATRSQAGFIDSDTDSILLVEFYDDTLEQIETRATRLFDKLTGESLGIFFGWYPEGEIYNNAWSIRKKGLGLLMGEPGDRRPLAFIEDAAIPVGVLPEYISRVLEVCEKYEVPATYYAHASVGVIHVRPFLDLREEGDIEIMKKISEEVFQLVIEYGGAWSGEHGDGLARGEYIRRYFGDKLYAAFREVKELFDPEYLMNPGKIIDPPVMTSNLRYGVGYHDKPFDSVYRYPEQRNFHTAVHQCSGLGSCRKVQSGTMCPSYMVTREEVHSTRGRANALRLAMSGQLSDKGLLDDELRDAMDLCISCKACKAECPSSVDMSRLKSEVQQLQYDNGRITLRDKLIRDSARMSKRFAGSIAPAVNAIQDTSLFRNISAQFIGFDKRRKLPEYAKQTFADWFKANYADTDHEKRVGLFADTYTNYHEPEIGKAAVGVIQALGYNIDLLEGCCQRPKISHGFLKDARQSALNTCRNIQSYGYDVLVCEPGCASAFTDDLPDLISDQQASNSIKSKVLPIEKWLERHLDELANSAIYCDHGKMLLHGHCHQKALYGTSSIHKIFRALDVEIVEPDSGCCGMAGSFGYEKEHYQISEKMYERVLGPAIRENHQLPVAASGFSCRHQINHFSRLNPVHWLELLSI